MQQSTCKWQIQTKNSSKNDSWKKGSVLLSMAERGTWHFIFLRGDVDQGLSIYLSEHSAVILQPESVHNSLLHIFRDNNYASDYLLWVICYLVVLNYSSSKFQLPSCFMLT